MNAELDMWWGNKGRKRKKDNERMKRYKRAASIRTQTGIKRRNKTDNSKMHSKGSRSRRERKRIEGFVWEDSFLLCFFQQKNKDYVSCARKSRKKIKTIRGAARRVRKG